MFNVLKNRALAKNIGCAGLTVLICAAILHSYFQINVFHSTNLDQQFHMPPLLHASRLAWLGEGSFVLNFLTGEQMWGAPHFSPYYPLYGPLAILFYDGLGIQDYVIIGDYIALIHRLILAVGCYYLARTLSPKYIFAICFAVFVATAEAVRIPSNWYIAICAYAWVPFMIGGAVDVFKRRFVRGLTILTLSTTLSVYAAPLYLGLGVALIPCVLILAGFTIFYFFEDGTLLKKNSFQKKAKVFSLLVLVAAGLVLMLTPILLSAYFGIEDYVRWLRTGPVTGKDISHVGSELFFEAKDWGYAQRLITDYGVRGIYSSYFLGSVFAFFYFAAPFVWALARKPQEKNEFNIRLILWLVALMHLSFIFGEKLILPLFLQFVPLVNSFRHLSAFGSIFIILAALCAFDAARIIVKYVVERDLKKAILSKKITRTGVIFSLVLALIWSVIFYFSGDKLLYCIVTAFIFIVFTLNMNVAKWVDKKFIIAVCLIAVSSVGIYQQQNSQFNKPVIGKDYAESIEQINEILNGVSTKGELFNAEISPKSGKSMKMGGVFVLSHASTLNFRVVYSYLSPRHFERFKAGRRTSTASLEKMKQAGITLLLIDKGFLTSGDKYAVLETEGSLLKSTKDFLLYRLGDSALVRTNAVCINHNICGTIRGDYVEFNTFSYEDLQFKDKNNVNRIIEHSKSELSPMLTKVPYNSKMELTASFKPKKRFFIIMLALFGVLLNISAILLLRRIL